MHAEQVGPKQTLAAAGFFSVAAAGLAALSFFTGSFLASLTVPDGPTHMLVKSPECILNKSPQIWHQR